jgi:phosphatidylglycerol:prolipoprotein diacylglycerol transferase
VIPYIKPFKWELGPLTLEPFGLFVAAGVLFGVWVGGKHARRIGLNVTILQDAAVWALSLGTLSGHWVHLFAYHPEEIWKNALTIGGVDLPVQIIRFWDGLSSMGGVVGGIIGALIFFRRRKMNHWDYADTIAVALAPGWAIARLGCFAVHDHPGIKSDAFFAVNFPLSYYGGPRLDLGLIDAVSLTIIAVLLWNLGKRDLYKGRLIGWLSLLYGAQRFFTDFLRATDLDYIDKRWFGLTFAQGFSLFLVCFGLYRLRVPPKLTHVDKKPGEPAAKPVV